MNKKFNVGDKVYTDTHAVHQKTQESLSRRTGIIVNNNDYPWNIHVEIEGIQKSDNPIGFSEFELSHNPITDYKNERIG